VLVGDGLEGAPGRAPFDRILVTAAAEAVPQALVDQLSDRGVLLLPLGPHADIQHIVRLSKSPEGVKEERLIPVRFVPLLPGQAREL
jgi:protein-L-isoaspartate(D-aspartate) O-methyltransferase